MVDMSGVEKFMVEKFGVEKLLLALGYKVINSNPYNFFFRFQLR